MTSALKNAVDTDHLRVDIANGVAVVTLMDGLGQSASARIPLQEWCQIVEQSRNKVRHAPIYDEREARIAGGVTPQAQTEK